jgi:hypothetical protein
MNDTPCWVVVLLVRMTLRIPQLVTCRKPHACCRVCQITLVPPPPFSPICGRVILHRDITHNFPSAHPLLKGILGLPTPLVATLLHV